MNKQLNIQRLYIALKEIYFPNRLLLAIFPLVMLLAFGLFYFWPNGIFYQKLFAPEIYPTHDDWTKAIYMESVQNKLMLIWIIPLYVVVITTSYFSTLNKSERVNLLPISNLERTLAITLFCFGGLLTGTLIFAVYDHLSVWGMKNMYYDDVLQYLENQGDLYPTFFGNSIFVAIPIARLFLISLVLFLSGVPLYMLSKVFFKRYSIVVFAALLVLITVVVTYIISKLFMYESAAISIGLKSFIPSAIQVLLAVVYWTLTLAAFYYKRKEREI